MSEGRRFQNAFAIEGEGENAAPARLDRADCGRIYKPGGTTPPDSVTVWVEVAVPVQSPVGKKL